VHFAQRAVTPPPNAIRSFALARAGTMRSATGSVSRAAKTPPAQMIFQTAAGAQDFALAKMATASATKTAMVGSAQENSQTASVAQTAPQKS
jgi:hypothetical protein